MSQIINHKGKHYLKTEKGYKEILATTDSSLKVINKINNNIIEFTKANVQKISKLPQPSKSFIEKYIELYNKGNVITEVLVEYIFHKGAAQQCPLGYNTNDSDWKELKVTSNNNTITIHPVKDSWNREEVQKILQEFADDKLPDTYLQTKQWIEENL